MVKCIFNNIYKSTLTAAIENQNFRYIDNILVLQQNGGLEKEMPLNEPNERELLKK